MHDMELYVLGSSLAKLSTMSDRFNELQSSGKLEDIYAAIATGSTVETLSIALGVSEKQLTVLLNRTVFAQQRYISAIAVHAGTSSFRQIQAKGDFDSLGKEEAAAMLHHRTMAKMGVDSLDKLATFMRPTQTTAPTIIVHNTTTVGDTHTPPPLPTELEGLVIDHEPETL